MTRELIPGAHILVRMFENLAAAFRPDVLPK